GRLVRDLQRRDQRRGAEGREQGPGAPRRGLGAPGEHGRPAGRDQRGVHLAHRLRGAPVRAGRDDRAPPRVAGGGGRRAWGARPAPIVDDATSQLVLFIPAGIHWMAPFDDGRRLKVQQADYRLKPQPYDEAHVLSLSWPKTRYAVLLFFHPDWSPWSWYVNLQDPLRRTAIGFDT